MKTGERREASPRVSRTAVKMFTAYTGWYAHRHFRSLRILRKGLPPQDSSRPFVIFLNHASWWDPLVCLLLAREFFPERTSFAPIETAMLERYGFFRRLGFFGVETGTLRGARQFLRTTRELLGASQHALWLTPQGRFMDVRTRPLGLQSGLGALARQNENAIFLPLAVEYTFWTEPRPEILVAFGAPIIPEREVTGSVDSWTRRFSDALEATQDELAARARRRAASDWLVLDRGKSGGNAIYERWRWLRAKISRQPYARDHYGEALP